MEDVQTKQDVERPKSLKKNSIFYLIYTVLNLVFPFATGVYVARVLLPNDIGQVAYAQNIAQYFVILAFLGIPTYGLREISKARNNKEELNNLYSELFIINFVSTVIFSLVYLTLVFVVPDFKQNIAVYLIVGISIALNALDVSWLYEGLEEFKFISLRSIVFKILSFALLLIFVKSTDDYLIYAAITVVGVAGNSVLNFLFSGKFVKFKVKGLSFKRHVKPILLLVAVNLAIEIYTLIDTTMLGIFCEKSHVTFYSYGSKIYRILLQVLNTFTIVLVPRLSAYYSQNKIDEFNGLISKCFRLILLLAIPMIIGLQFVSEFAISKIYGEAYIKSAYVLRLLSPMLLFAPLGYLLGSRVLLISGHEGKMAICVGIGAVTNVIGNLILIRPYEEFGAAIASSIGEFIVMTVYIFMARKQFKLVNTAKSIFKIVVSAVLMTGYLFACKYIPLGEIWIFFIQLIGAVIIYFTSLYLMKEELVKGNADRFLRRLLKRGRTES